MRVKRSIPLSAERQGYIYYVSRLYRELPEKKRAVIDELCKRAGGEHAEAVKAFVTTNEGKTGICMRYYLSESTLERCIRKYYMEFPRVL